MDVHQRLASLLEAKGLTQTLAAERLKCHQTTLSKICLGKRKPGRALALRIEALSVDWEEGPISPSDWDTAEAA